MHDEVCQLGAIADHAQVRGIFQKLRGDVLALVLRHILQQLCALPRRLLLRLLRLVRCKVRLHSRVKESAGPPVASNEQITRLKPVRAVMHISQAQEGLGMGLVAGPSNTPCSDRAGTALHSPLCTLG